MVNNLFTVVKKTFKYNFKKCGNVYVNASRKSGACMLNFSYSNTVPKRAMQWDKLKTFLTNSLIFNCFINL